MSESQSLAVLAFGPHPDDVEIFAGGIICSLTRDGHPVGIIDLTEGELGSRGSVEERRREAAAAAEILGVAFRSNLGLPDGGIENSEAARRQVIREIRRHRPEILLIPAPECRHPDHGAAARLVSDASFFSGLRKIEVEDGDGVALEAYRPTHVLHYIQSIDLPADLVVDVGEVWDQKMEAVRAYGSQVHNPAYQSMAAEPTTFVSDPGFLRWIEARAVAAGYRAGFAYGEGLIYRHGPIGTRDLISLLGSGRRKA